MYRLRLVRAETTPSWVLVGPSGTWSYSTRLSARGIWAFVTNFGNFISAVFGNDDEVLDEVRPVSVIGITQFGAASQRAGLNFTLELIAYISVFVGLVNAIPLYPF